MKINAQANKAELFLYGYIGFDETASDFLQHLKEQEAVYSQIDVHINSGGGSIFEGLPIYNILKSSKAEITTIVDGLAASMASVIMLGGKKVKCATNAMIMVHGPQGGDYTNIENLENIVEMMKNLRTQLAKIYAAKTGRTEQWVLDNWLSDGRDHWLTAQEAKDFGLVDELFDAGADVPQAAWGLRRIAAFYNERLSNFNNQTQPNTMKKVIAAINGSKVLTLREDASEELAAEAVNNLALKLSSATTELATKDAQLAAKDAEIVRLQKEANDAKTVALKDKATNLVDGAVAAKKITAAQKERFVTLASKDEDGYTAVKEMLDSMQGYQPVGAQLKDGGADVQLPATKELRIKLHDEHAKAGTLATLPTDVLKAVWKEKHGKEPSESTLKALGAK